MTSIDPAEYEYLWSNHDINYIFTSCYLSPVFRTADIVLTYDWKKKELKYFLSKENQKRIADSYVDLYRNRFEEWKKQIGVAIEKGELIARETEAHKSSVESMSNEELGTHIMARVRLFQSLCDDYFPTEFFSVEKAEHEAAHDPKLKATLEEMGHIKFRARGVLNTFYNYNQTFRPYVEELGRRLGRSDMEWLSFEEITRLSKGESVSVSKRAESYWVLAQRVGWEPLIGDKARAILKNFDQYFFKAPEGVIKGIPASKGFARGPVTILRTIFSDSVSEELKKMKKGDVLVANTTGPEIMVACKLASAIVTDEGGLTSHAAIVSRELGIPCIVGTKIGSKVLNDGDMVEVDAKAGIVRKV